MLPGADLKLGPSWLLKLMRVCILLSPNSILFEWVHWYIMIILRVLNFYCFELPLS